MKPGPVLVTGCAGFVGSTLVDELLARGREVVGIDAFETFYSREIKERNLRLARTSHGFRFQEMDTRAQDELRSFVSAVRPSVVVDFAARAGVRDSLRDPALYIDINVRGVQSLLSAVEQVGAEFVFASSSSVYGAVPIPFREDTTPCRPLSPYGATKIAGEALVAAHRAITGLPVRIARLFTVYGPRQRPDLAVHLFADRLVEGKAIPLYAGGEATRDYTYVGDVVDGFVRLIDSQEPDLTVNLGSGRPYSNFDLVRHLERSFGMEATIELLPPQPGDAPATLADNSRAHSTLGWDPGTTLEEGLARFRDWFFAEAHPRRDHVSV